MGHTAEPSGSTEQAVLDREQLTLSLRERVKELTCLYEIAQIAATPKLSLPELLERVAACLPPAWQYPEIAAARITLDDQQFATDRFEQKAWARQGSPIRVDGALRGLVEVVYLEPRPEVGEGPFLAEERKLIDTIASDLTLIIQRKTMEAERERLQAQLRHADRLATIGQLAAGVAHELNEPLGSILGFAQLIRKHPALPEQAARDAGRIEEASLYAREIIRKLMLFARKTQPSKRPVELNPIVEEGLAFLSARCQKAGIELCRDLEAGLPLLTADPAQLLQVVVNLVVNALQAMPQGGALSVVTRAQTGFVSLLVKDTGLGMSDAVVGRIFDPFFTTKDVGEGTGLGLSVVHGIVCAHGGQIHVTSAEGRGSCFEIRLPVPGPETSEG